MRSLARLAALAAGLAVTGCDDEGTPLIEPVRGYVPMLTGKVAVFDPETLERTDTLGEGHSIVHGVGVTTKGVWLGDRDSGVLRRHPDGLSTAIGHPINRVVSSATLVAASGDDPDHPFDAHVTVVDAASGATHGTLRIPLDEARLGPTSRPTGDASPPAQECPTCPRTGVALCEAQGRAWIVHTRNRALYEVTLPDLTLVGRTDIPSPDALSPFLAGCDPVATADLHGRRFSVWPDGPFHTPNTGQLAVEVEWSPDGRTLYGLTAESEVIIGDESHNAGISTEILALSADDLSVRARATFRTALNHIAPGPAGRHLFATTTSGTVVRFDAVSLVQTGEAQIAAGQPPVLDVYF